MNEKDQRHEKILELLVAQSIASHEDLCKGLEKLGFSVGQATVSRDLKEIGVVRSKGKYQVPANRLPRSEQWKRTFREKIHKVQEAGSHILVIKGVLGCAPTVSVEIEALNWPEIVGVIAGDDTLFFAFSNESDLNRIKKRLQAEILVDESQS